MHVSHGDPAHVWVRLEDGTVRTDIRQADNFTPQSDLDGTLIGEATFVLPADLPLAITGCTCDRVIGNSTPH